MTEQMTEQDLEKARAFMERECPSGLGRERGSLGPEALDRLVDLSSIGLHAPRPVVLRPAAETLAGMKLSQVVGRLLQERHVLGMTLMNLHDETGITCGRLSRLEKGIDTNPTIGTLARIAEGLGIELVVKFAGSATAT